MLNDIYGTQEIQQYLKGVLKAFHQFCMDNDIKYSVWDGSMLGTIRHKGFIPWDDDVDVILNRENYNKLIELCSKKQPDFHITSRLWIRRIEIEGNKWASMDSGVIDLLVFDNTPDNPIAYKIKVLLLKILQGMMKDMNKIELKNYQPVYRPLVFITALMGLPFSEKTKFDWYDRISQWGNKKKTKKKGVFNEPFAYVGRIKYPNDGDEYLIMPFEDIKVMICMRFDEYLTLTFGDYMTPPPINERMAQHIVIESNLQNS